MNPLRSALPIWFLSFALFAATSSSAEVLDPMTLTKYIDPLPVPGAMPMAGPDYYEIGVWQIQQQLHSQLPLTTLYGYGTSQATASYPGATIVARKGVPISVRWTNHLTGPHILDYAIDPTIPMAQTTTGVPIVPHLHGGETEPESDGTPAQWFTAGFAEKGQHWQKEIFEYANDQLPATIWYHDHAFGFTRHNVYAGLAGFYVITDPGNEPAGLPSGPYDIGLAIQDRMFTTDGQLWYPNEGVSDVHPIWIPEFFGDVILVNGKVWPYLNVEPRKYRFRILEGSNARFYSLALADPVTEAPGPAFHQIASDGGYLAAPVLLNDPNDPNSPRLLMAPGERAEVIIDFSGYEPGAELVLQNNAKAPFPNGEPPDPETTGQIMLFRVVPLTAPDDSVIPQTLATVTRLDNPTLTRVMTLNEVMDEDEPVAALLNGMPFHHMDAPITELPTLGTTEMWEIVNMTGDTHPIHLHLVQFQLLDRQRINAKRYERAFMDANPEIPADHYVPVPVDPYLQGKPTPPPANERGWKDTFRMNPGEVTRILVRFAPQDESPSYSFDATAEPGYVWHCHILEHEENDMMRPYRLVAPGAPEIATASVDVATQAAGTTLGLLAPRPNPTASGAMFHFTLGAPGTVELAIYGATGQRMRQLMDARIDAGEHAISWDGRDDGGRTFASGIYFVTLRANGQTSTRKLSVAP
jgi:spore coat protein A